MPKWVNLLAGLAQGFPNSHNSELEMQKNFTGSPLQWHFAWWISRSRIASYNRHCECDVRSCCTKFKATPQTIRNEPARDFIGLLGRHQTMLTFPIGLPIRSSLVYIYLSSVCNVRGTQNVLVNCNKNECYTIYSHCCIHITHSHTFVGIGRCIGVCVCLCVTANSTLLCSCERMGVCVDVWVCGVQNCYASLCMSL